MKKQDRILKLLKFITFTLLIIAPLAFVHPKIDGDAFFMISHGRYIVENGFPTKEILTVHSDYDFNIQKWASCLLFYFLWEKAKEKGLIAFLYVTTAVIELLLYKLLKYISNNTTISITIASLCMIIMNGMYIQTRPQVFSYIFILLEIYFLERYVKTNNWENLIALPIISFLYMQFHSTQWIMLFIILLCYLFDICFLQSDRLIIGKYKKRPVIAFAIISAFVGLINPYGIKYITYIFNAFIDTGHLKYITECQPATFETLLPLFVPIILVIIPIWKGKSFPLRYGYLALGTFGMNLIANRNQAYAIIGIGVLMAFLWKGEILYNKKSFFITLFFISVTITLGGIKSNINCWGYPYKHSDRIYAWNTLAQNVAPNKNIRVYTGPNEGSYGEFLGYSVYMDSRTEVFSKRINNTENTFEEWESLIFGKISLADFQNKYHFNYYILEKNEYPALELELRQFSGWIIRYESDTYLIVEATK